MCFFVLVCVYFSFFFFFFKQKTAYEMRISDWSSDVCSSDLLQRFYRRSERSERVFQLVGHVGGKSLGRVDPLAQGLAHVRQRAGEQPDLVSAGGRSEEHTSELQSLMRISYAVFCLKKKTTTQIRRTETLPYY